MGYQEQDDFAIVSLVGQRELGWSEAKVCLHEMQKLHEAVYNETNGLNPWLNLPLTSETQLWKHGAQFTSHFRLKSLPNELLLMIASFLPPESSTALALTDRHLKELLGFVVERLNPPLQETRQADIASCGWKFLRLLEKDSSDKVACPGCMRLHTPFWRSDAGRVCEKYWMSHPWSRPTQCFHYLNIRHVVIQHARKPFKDCQLIPAASNIRMLFHDEMKGAHTVSTCFVNGRLLSRVQTVLAPRAVLHEPLSYSSWRAVADVFGAKGGLSGFGDWPCHHVDHAVQVGNQPSTRAMVRELIEAGIKHVPGFEQLEIEYPDKIKDSLDRYDRLDKLENDHRRYAGPAGRLRTAKEVVKILFAQRQGLIRDLSSSFQARISRCQECCTEATAGIQNIQGLGPVVVVTYWKDFGGPGRDDRDVSHHWRWSTHKESVRGNHFLPRRCRRISEAMARWTNCSQPSEAGEIAAAFEGKAPLLTATTGGQKAAYVTPSIPSELVDDLRRGEANETAEYHVYNHIGSFIHNIRRGADNSGWG